MARRRRSKIPRKRSSRLLMATQVVLLVGVLVVILFFRDFIADGAGQMLGTFGTGDVQVQKSVDDAPQSEDPSGEKSGDKTSPAPASDASSSE